MRKLQSPDSKPQRIAKLQAATVSLNLLMQSRSVTLSNEFVYVSRQTAALRRKLLHPFDLLRARNIMR